MMSGQQYVRHGTTAPLGRSGVLRIFKQSLREAFLDQRFRIADDTGQQPYTGIDQSKRRRFSARQDEVANADFPERTFFDQSCIDAFKPAA